MAGVLRDYQSDMVQCVGRAFASGHSRVYGSLPTGCGKTRAASELVASAAHGGRRVLWMVHRRELVDQARDAIMDRLSDDGLNAVVGVVMASQTDVGADIVVASVQSLRMSRLDEILACGPISRVIVDECHHVTAGNTYGAIIDRTDAACIDETGQPARVVGITATPFRSDRADMQKVLPYCAFERHIGDMIRDGWLCELAYHRVKIDALDLTHVSISRKLGQADYADRDIAPAVERIDIVEETVSQTAAYIDRGLDHAPRPTVVFAASVYHAQLLAQHYTDAGLRAEAVWGAMGDADRTRVIEAWKRGDIDVVTNCAVLTEGFDFPGIEAVIIARPTMSVGLYLQMVGRGTRNAEGKTDCIVIDITGRMPPKSAPIDLSDVVGEDLDEDASGMARINKARKAGGLSLHKLRDPYGRTRFLWTEHPVVSNAMFAPVGERAHACMITDAHSGLVTPWLIIDKSEARQISTEPMPLRQAIADTELTLAANKSVFRTALASKTSKWRGETASDKQLSLLSRMNGNMGARARAEQWSKGDVSLAVDAMMITKIVTKLAE